ncbi:MAG TPA: ABC transporter permease [Kofleriaceae bacterium]|jgi:ABC-type Na+ efflux pump permease subunit
MASPPPSRAAALSALARVTLKRSTRGALVWIALAIAFVPALAAGGLRAAGTSNGNIAFDLIQAVLVILAPMFIASSIGEELEQRTAAYLWSRPVERWAIVAGKLLALAPMCAAFVVGGALLAGLVGDATLRTAQPIIALAAGSLVSCAAVAGIATLLPRHAMIFAMLYLLLDLVPGELDGSLHIVSIGYATRATAGLESSAVVTGAIALAAIAAFWLVIAGVRIRRLET